MSAAPATTATDSGSGANGRAAGRRLFAPLPVALARVPLLASASSGGGAEEPVDPLVIEGVFVASRQAAGLTAGGRQEPLGVRQAATLRSYTLRARSRPTPQGVFAGVAAAFFREVTHSAVTMGGRHRARSVPDPGWLAAVADLLLDDRSVLPLLTLWANNLAVRRGDRLEQEQPAEPGTSRVQRVAVRATDATVLIMEVCARGAGWNTVLHAVTGRWPAVPEPVVTGMVVELVRRGFLLTDLLPERGTDDPLGHLLRRLPDSNALRDELTLIRRHLTDADSHPPGATPRLDALAAARQVTDRILAHDHPFRVDVAVDADPIVLPARLARQAADAATVLWRIGHGADPLASFCGRFTGRYGQNRFVPLLDAIDPVIGIAVEPTETGPAISRTTTALLGAMIASVTTRQDAEIELDPATVEALAAAGGSGAELPPRTAEIYVRVLAASPQAAARGQFFLAVCPQGATQQAGSTSGRFSTLLPDLREAGYQEEGAQTAELVVRSRTPSGATLAPPTGFAPHRIPLGVPARPADVAVEDLLLVYDGRHLSLWSASLDRPVVPALYSRLSPHLLPPVAQFLRLLAQHGSRPLRTWSWGPLAGTPFQPRLRYGPTILAPARWTLPPAVTGAARRAADWDTALDTWRNTAVPALPSTVIVTEHDKALPLDLHRADDRELLRRYVARGATAVTEPPGGPTAIQGVVAGPDGQHVLELVVSLTRTRPTSPALATAPATVARRPGEGLHLPGGRWLSVIIRTPVTCQDEVITRLAAAVHDFETPWFWLRYTDHAGPHLRVRFHGDPAELGGRILPVIADLTEDLIAERLTGGLTVEPYEQEIERYGGSPATMTGAEEVFFADSRLVLAMLAATQNTDEKIIRATLSAATITRTLADGDRVALAGHHVDREARRHMARLRPRTRAAVSADGPAEQIPGPLWQARQKALYGYRKVLDPACRARCASSLTHLHINRLLGDTALEPLVRALAVDLLYTNHTILQAAGRDAG